MQSENKTMGEMINAYYESIPVTKSAKAKAAKKLVTNKEVIRLLLQYLKLLRKIDG